ncbi:uncharacterized protein LOC131244617 isoform X2 [Magnolia sinica]|uniref:uncharacterized protein LOC131244617 isoform X2 n=1 Tax=Magnolia sinica TaxID=86752 RepID=UPI002658EECA|nr:uncharacterized protein LOC131244617 isoform X2 [Magnolia sinica]
MGSLIDHSITVDHWSGPDNVELRISIRDEEMAECRICQEEEFPFKLEAPCGCSGSIKYAHRACVQKWCNEKGNTICEICNQAYMSGYTAIPRREERRLIGNANAREQRYTRIRDSAADGHDSEIRAKSGLAFCCGSASIVLLALVFLQHVLSIIDALDGDNSSMLLMILVLRATGFLLLCYITIGAMCILRRAQHGDHVGTVERRDAIVYFIFLFSSFLFFFHQSLN